MCLEKQRNVYFYNNSVFTTAKNINDDENGKINDIKNNKK